MTPEQAEERVRQDAADRMQHTTTSDLSARLMCRVGFRELTLLLAHYDGLKQAHADRIIAGLTEVVAIAKGETQPSRIIEPVTPETVFRAGDRVRANGDSCFTLGEWLVGCFTLGEWLVVRATDADGDPILEEDQEGDDCGWSRDYFDRIERAPQ